MWMAEHHPQVTDLSQTTWPSCMSWLQSMADAGLKESTLRRRFAFLRTHACPKLKEPTVQKGYEKHLKGLLKSMPSQNNYWIYERYYYSESRDAKLMTLITSSVD